MGGGHLYGKSGLRFALQGDHSTCSKPPVDFKTKVLFWPGQARTGQASPKGRGTCVLKSTEVLNKWNGHPVTQSVAKFMYELELVKIREET